MVGDLAGFAAAIYQRGMPFVQVPTTLLAQVDSSVGGKTAINHPLGKNMIGAFHQPRAVIADVATLDTLPERELRAGLAEVIKYGARPGRSLSSTGWRPISRSSCAATARRWSTRSAAAASSRRAIVAADEREAGVRALLNFGHTFGHAIEAGAGYGAWLHGEAVAAGMVMAAQLSTNLGLIGDSEVSRVREPSRQGRTADPRSSARARTAAWSSWPATRRQRRESRASCCSRRSGGRRCAAGSKTNASAKPLSLQRSNCIFVSSAMSLPAPQGLYDPGERARRLRRRLRRAHQGQEVATPSSSRA